MSISIFFHHSVRADTPIIELPGGLATLQIEFRKPVSLDAFLSSVTDNVSDELILESDFTINNEAIHDFFVVNTENTKSIKEDYIRNRIAFIADTIGTSLLSSLVMSSEIGNIALTKVTATGMRNTIEEMRKKIEGSIGNEIIDDIRKTVEESTLAIADTLSTAITQTPGSTLGDVHRLSEITDTISVSSLNPQLPNNGSLQGQPGHRTPSDCYTTWCSFGDGHYDIVQWSTSIPGTQSWGESPAAPSNVSITGPTSTSLRVNFKDNATNETNVIIERKTGTNGSWAVVKTTGVLPGTGNWYWINSSLSRNTRYCYRLRAKNIAYYSAYSSEICGTTLK